jgi:hypothetical protein
MSRLALKYVQPTVPTDARFPYQDEVDHSAPFSAEVKNK